MATSLRYPKRTPHGSITRPVRRRLPTAGVLATFYDDTGRWLGQFPAATEAAAKEMADLRFPAWGSSSFSRV